MAGPGSAEEAAQLTRQLSTPFPVVPVAGRETYETLGFERAWLGLVQQSGTALIDKQGVVRYQLRAATPMGAFDGPGLMAALKGL